MRHDLSFLRYWGASPPARERDEVARADAFSDVGRFAPLTGLSSLFGPVDVRSAVGVPSISQAVRIAAQGVARLRLGVWAGEGPERRLVRGAWQSELFRRPNDRQTRFEFLEVIEESLSLRGNAFVWKNVDPSSKRVVELWALHPDQVEHTHRGVGGCCEWNVYVGGGFVDPTGRDKPGRLEGVRARDILHVRGHGGGALCIAPSPLELFADAIAAASAKTKRERAYYERGAFSEFMLAFPPEMTSEQAREFRELWEESYAGARNAGRTPVVGGGPNVVPIGLSQREAQFVESVGLSVEDAARIFNVPPSLLGVQKSDRLLSPEHEEDRWLRYGLGPRLERIEAAFAADPDLFPPGARVRPRFDTSEAIRGDLKTESELLVAQKQAGILTANEARAYRGLPPVEGGDALQKTPVGGAPGDTGDDAPPPSQDGTDNSDDQEVDDE